MMEGHARTTSLVDVLDRVLDKGIVIDAWVSVKVVGIDLVSVEARVIVASVETYLKHAELLARIDPVAHPTLPPLDGALPLPWVK